MINLLIRIKSSQRPVIVGGECFRHRREASTTDPLSGWIPSKVDVVVPVAVRPTFGLFGHHGAYSLRELDL